MPTPPPQIAPNAEKVPRRRWMITWLLGFGIMVNYFDRANLSVSQDALHSAFGISTSTFGILSGAYVWTYMLLQVPSGLLLDRFGVKLIGRVSTFLWSVASFAAALSTGIGGFFAARLLLGVGEAPTFPANAKAIGYWFPKAERSLGTAVFDGAAKFGAALGAPLLGLVLVHFGWRWCFAASGIISVVFFAMFAAYYKNPSEDTKLSDVERDFIARGGAQPEDKVLASQGAPIGYLLKRKKVWGMSLGYASYNYSFYLLFFWLPTYIKTNLHLTLLRSAIYTGIPWLFATFAEIGIGGLLVDALIERGWNGDRVRRTVLIGGTSLGLALLLVGQTVRPVVALFWISIAICGLSAASPIGWSLPSLLAPRESVGTLGGILNTCNQISAFAAATATGFILQNHKHTFALAFAVAGIYLIIGIAAYVFLLGRIDQLPEPPQRIGIFPENAPR
jgi:MFS transporter, ACS family, D-galactonate transporter